MATTRLNLQFMSMQAGFLILSGFLAGCGGSATGPKIAPVYGKVTLDGKPLGDALVQFIPQNGRPASSSTNAEGEYSLIYSQSAKGAALGGYKVKITTGREADYVTGEQITSAVPEKVPAKYNEKSELTAEVKPGKNVFDFGLQSK